MEVGCVSFPLCFSHSLAFHQIMDCIKAGKEDGKFCGERSPRLGVKERHIILNCTALRILSQERMQDKGLSEIRPCKMVFLRLGLSQVVKVLQDPQSFTQ